MIVDSHGHLFQNWSEPCGHESKAIHLKYLQKTLTRSPARVFRFKDGGPGETQHLFRKGDNTWDGLRDVNFRVGTYGRLEFTVHGEDYYSQFMPVNMANLEAPPELLLTQMNLVGVDHCVLQAGMNYGVMNDYNALAQQKYPDKFTGLLHVDSAMAYTQQWMEEVDRAYSRLNLRGIYYEIDDFSRYGYEWTFDDARMDPFWELASSLDVPVFIGISSIPKYDQASYIANIKRLDGLLTRFPKMRWLLIMCPPVQYFAKNGKWEFPPEVDQTYRRENLQLEVVFPIVWGGVWDYPFPEAQALIRDLRDKYGAEKLVWGSDIPNVERFCTYKQCIDYILRYCNFLTSREKDLIMGKNLIDLCKIKLSPSKEVSS